MAKITRFEEFSEIYDDWFEKNKEKYAAELLALRCFVPTNAHGLEVGVGSGLSLILWELKSALNLHLKWLKKRES